MPAHLGIVVEGDGDERAVPLLLRRLMDLHQRWIELSRPVNPHGRGNLLKGGELERFVSLAARRPGCGAVLVVCDAEDDAICESGPEILNRVRNAVPDIPVGVCLAGRQFENWILASHETTLPQVPVDADDLEAVVPTPYIRAHLGQSQSYVKPVYQPRLTNAIDFDLARARSPSFDRFLRVASSLIDAVSAEHISSG